MLRNSAGGRVRHRNDGGNTRARGFADRRVPGHRAGFAAHFANHFQNLTLPPLFPFLKEQLGIGFVELGLALTVANISWVAAQLPVGYLVDRLGSRRMLVAGLVISGLAFGSSAWPVISRLLVAMAFVGLANSVFHPADYAILSARCRRAARPGVFGAHLRRVFRQCDRADDDARARRLDRDDYRAGRCRHARARRGGAARDGARRRKRGARVRATQTGAAERGGLTAILTPTIIGLTGFFALLSLSGSGISSFSVVALTGAYGTRYRWRTWR